MGFSIKVTEDSVTAKIYKIRNKFCTVRLENDEAKAHAKKKVEGINKGEFKGAIVRFRTGPDFYDDHHYVKKVGLPKDLLAKEFDVDRTHGTEATAGFKRLNARKAHTFTAGDRHVATAPP